MEWGGLEMHNRKQVIAFPFQSDANHFLKIFSVLSCSKSADSRVCFLSKYEEQNNNDHHDDEQYTDSAPLSTII